MTEDAITALTDYIECVVKYEADISREMENNLDFICETLQITRDEVKRSQEKYINN
jgi:hypothetical protein